MSTPLRNDLERRGSAWLRALAASLTNPPNLPKSTYDAGVLVKLRRDPDQTVPSADVPLLL